MDRVFEYVEERNPGVIFEEPSLEEFERALTLGNLDGFLCDKHENNILYYDFEEFG